VVRAALFQDKALHRGEGKPTGPPAIACAREMTGGD
jgi:hypothetical protein